MLRIGEFSNLSRVSVKTLHHYDDIGLLQPAHIDAQTGYRYYEAVQLTRLMRIRALKELGFSLDDITLLLRPDLTEVERAPIVTRRREEQEKQVQTEQQRLLRLQRLAVTTEGETEGETDGEQAAMRTAQLPIFYKPLPALRVASWRAPARARPEAQLEQEITARFLAMAAFLQAHNIRMTGAGVMLWHDAEWQEEVTDAEAATPIELPLTSALPPHATIRASELPPIPLAACVTYRGSAQGGQAQAAYIALADGLQAQGFRLDGPRRDVTLHYDFLTGDRVVEVQFPVAPV